MTIPRLPVPSLLVVAAFSRYAEALTWARDRLQVAYGSVAMTSPAYRFHQTDYYRPTMGADLCKQFFTFENLVAPDALAGIKLHTIGLEASLAASGAYPEPRPANLDPGLLQLGKFLLATTKDQAHRIYLRTGIFAEVTLSFHDGAFVPWPWTYADYREPALLEYLKTARDYYRSRLGGAGSAHAE